LKDFGGSCLAILVQVLVGSEQNFLLISSKFFVNFGASSSVICELIQQFFWSKFFSVLDDFGASYLGTSELVQSYLFSTFGASSAISEQVLHGSKQFFWLVFFIKQWE